MEMPPLAARAYALAEALGLEMSCTPEDGALLHVLAARRDTMRAAEIGTCAGVGAAWIVSALPPQVPFVTIECDAELAARAAELFAGDPNVRVLCGSWREALPVEAPFDLLVVGAHDAKDDVDAMIGLLAPGGTAVLGDLRREPGRLDPRRDAWLGHPLLSAVEVWVTPGRRAVVAVRRR